MSPSRQGPWKKKDEERGPNGPLSLLLTSRVHINHQAMRVAAFEAKCARGALTSSMAIASLTFTLRMIERFGSSRNSTRTWVTLPVFPVRPRTLVTLARFTA